MHIIISSEDLIRALLAVKIGKILGKITSRVKIEADAKEGMAFFTIYNNRSKERVELGVKAKIKADGTVTIDTDFCRIIYRLSGKVAIKDVKGKLNITAGKTRINLLLLESKLPEEKKIYPYYPDPVYTDEKLQFFFGGHIKIPSHRIKNKGK